VRQIDEPGPPFATTVAEHQNADGAPVLTGPWRHPVNLLKQQTYADHASIHDDATAQRLGFRGGTIEGPTHFSQFAPLLLRAFGLAWFEAGFISASYRQASYEGEAVQAHVTPRGADRADVALLKSDGSVVLLGDAGVGSGSGQGAVRQRLARARPLAEPRILAGCYIGQQATDVCVRMNRNDSMGDLYPFSLADKLDVITEPSPWYTEGVSTPWGGPILPIEMASVLCQSVADRDPFPIHQPVVGLFADQEIVLLDGPLHPGVAYRLSREIVALSETPRTESVWILTRIRDASTDQLKGEMLLNQAFLKASSSLYESQPDAAS
jgi:hypothetical protein